MSFLTKLSSASNTPLLNNNNNQLLTFATATIGILAWVRHRQYQYHSKRTINTNTKHTSHLTIQSLPPTKDIMEKTSFSNFHEARCTHGSFCLDVDMNKKIIYGNVTWTVALATNNNNNKNIVILDSRSLKIKSCSLLNNNNNNNITPLNFKLAQPEDPVFGSALTIDVGNPSTREIMIKIEYETTSDSTAIQFLDPEQTAGKIHPYLFTQCQAIHARSFFPCQDAPAVKTTWDALVNVPFPLQAVMSGLNVVVPATTTTTTTTTTITDKSTNHHRSYKFEQRVPTCSYLVALVVGELESKDLGRRTRVWAEPSIIKAAAWEFEEVENFVNVGEQLFGPYVWERYDFVVLPKSFPYGGMENPNLTFLTPTLLAGDRSLVDVCIHEICHSWTGNLVTNATWEDFWLNEGWTVFGERRLVHKLYGGPRAGLKTVIGRRHLEDDVKRMGLTHVFTQLHIPSNSGPNNTVVDPDDSFSSVPYEKGADFLEELERRVGGAHVFESFVKKYVAEFQFGLVSSKTFMTFFDSLFPGVMTTQDWNTWIYTPGMPPPPPPGSTDTTLVDLSESCAIEWCKTGQVPAVAKHVSNWSCDQIVVCLEKILQIQGGNNNTTTNISDSALNSIVSHFNLREAKNAEIRLRAYTLMLRSPTLRDSTFPLVVKFVEEQGRMKFVRPMYREMCSSSEKGKQLARETFNRLKNTYHAIAAKMIAKDNGF
jgi:leukotriene-A4 hydrolase